MLLRWQARRRRDERFDNAKRYREEFGWERAPQSEPMQRMRQRFGNYLEVVACGRPFIVDLRDTVVGPGILYYGVWEPEKSELFNHLLHAGDRVVDIGANIGYFTVLFAAAVGDAGRVLAIEPDPDNVRLLRENLHINGLSAWTSVVRAAAGPRADRLYLYSKGGVTNRGDHRTFGDGGSSGAKRSLVRMVAVDDCVRSWPSVQTIKMDIQGYESFALHGMRTTLERNAGIALVTEFWPSEMRRAGSDPHDFLRELTKLGFAAWRISAATLSPVESETLVSELEPDGVSADLVFMRPRFASQRLGGLLRSLSKSGQA